MESCPTCPEGPDNGCGNGNDDDECAKGGTCRPSASSDGSGDGDGDGCPGSLSFRFFLGKRAFGRDAGWLKIYAKTPNTDLATPAGLEYSKGRNHAPNDVDLIDDGNGDLRQVKTPRFLADIVTITAYNYQIRFYDQDSIGPFSGGLYNQSGETPFAVWTVDNPDTSSSYDKLYISQTIGATCRKEYRFEFTGASDKWTMEAGDCSAGFTAMKEVERSSSYNGQGNIRTDTIGTYSGAQLVRQSVQTWEDFGWGHVLTSAETGTGTDKIDMARTWHTDSGQTGKYRKLKSWTNSDGSWVMQDYDTDGRVTVKVSSWKNTTMPQTVDSSVAHAIVNDYTPISGTDDDGTLFPRRPRTVTEKINGTPVSKTFHVYYQQQTPNERIIEIVERAADPQGDYGDTGKLRTTSEYYLANAHNIDHQHLARVTHPDGTVDEYTWDEYTWGTPATGTYSPALSNGVPVPGTFTPGSASTDLDVKTIIEHHGPPVSWTRSPRGRSSFAARRARPGFMRLTPTIPGGASARSSGWPMRTTPVAGKPTRVAATTRR